MTNQVASVMNKNSFDVVGCAAGTVKSSGGGMFCKLLWPQAREHVVWRRDILSSVD